MSSKIVIVDYGMGNLHSVNKAIAVVGGDRLFPVMPQLLHRLIN